MYNYDDSRTNMPKLPFPLTERRSLNDSLIDSRKRQNSEESTVFIYHNGKLTKYHRESSPRKDTFENSENSTFAKKKYEVLYSNRVRLSYSTERPKLPSLYNSQHLDLQSLFGNSQNRNFNVELFVRFTKSYDIEFIEGYKDDILTKCVQLIKLENDIDYIDINFSPNFCKKFVDQRDTMFSSPQVSKYNKLSLSEEKFNFPSQIMSERRGYKPMTQSKKSFSTKPKIRILNITNDDFKNEMGFYKDFSNVCKFYIINAMNNGARSEFGFFEIAREAGGKNVVLSKFYIGKIFRKMALVPSIALKIVTHIFTEETNVEKIIINLKSSHTEIHKDLATLSFKFERNNPKLPSFSIYSLTKKDFLTMLNKF